jgi:outer membrane protein TolC
MAEAPVLSRIVLVVGACMTGCTAGPRHVTPATPLPEQFDQAPATRPAAPDPSALWSGFGSAELDGLVARALEANTTLRRPGAQETRALSGLTHFSWFPTVTAAGGRERPAPSSLGSRWRHRGDGYRRLRCVWEIDLFGGLQRRPQPSAVAWADDAALAAARLSIVTETAQAGALQGARARQALSGGSSATCGRTSDPRRAACGRWHDHSTSPVPDRARSGRAAGS